MKKLLIVRENYVINAVMVSDADYPTYVYPHPHDFVFVGTEYTDVDKTVHYKAQIGDWWEASEGIFYHPLGTPPDLPEELL